MQQQIKEQFKSQNFRIQFQAGKCTFDKNSREVVPLKNKGKIVAYMVTLFYQNHDQQRHFKYINDKGQVEMDHYMFPGDTIFQRVGTRNIYVLRFESYDDKFFFWMQNPDRQKWDSFCLTVNKIINDQQQIGIPSLAVKQSKQIVIEKPANRKQQKSENNIVPYLSELLTGEGFHLILQEKELCQQLVKYLPEGQQSIDHLRENLLSPQFLQALKSLDMALTSNEIMGLFYELGLDLSFLESEIGHKAFYKALNEYGRNKSK